ncbi:MAG TPA: hypothetical protein VNL77_16185 [Roseiflexaceae bacterium]|nr:hypothetical protein [Roseiflexaceae bacterium]
MAINQSDAVRPALERLQRIALIVGGVALALTVLGYFVSGAPQFYHSYIFAFFFWIALSLSGLLLLMINHLTQGVWGLMLRRSLESAALTLPLMALLFLPIVLGLLQGVLYPWTHAEVQAEEVVARKLPYLNIPFWLARAAIFFGIWSGAAYLLNRWSDEQERAGHSEGLLARFKNLSGPGIAVLVLTWSLAATDWGMSLEPAWFSSMYPVTFIASMLILGFAFNIIVLNVLVSRDLLPYRIPVDRLHDIGKFLFAFVVLWSYVNFSEYLIIWSGNIPEETFWFGHRTQGGWEYLATAMIFGHFFLPFFLLLSRFAKRNIGYLTGVAIYMVAIELVWYFWKIMPAFYPEGFHLSWTDVTALLGIGGLWLGLWALFLKRRPLLPLNDPLMERLREQQHAHGHGHGAAEAAHH